MTENLDPFTKRLHLLREEFDRSFAQPLAQEKAEQGELLCFSTDRRRFAVLLADLQALAKIGAVIRVPSRATALIGLTSIRASLMPLYSAAALTGDAIRADDPTWMAVLRGDAPAALGFDSLDGYAKRQQVTMTAGSSKLRFVNGSVEHQGQLYAVLDCDALYKAVTHPAHSAKGQDQTI